VIENLIANALRFTPEGGRVLVRCAREPEGRASVSVSDTGRGIPQEDLPHIFDRFYKSSDSRGMGLGLAIARSLVEAHGGEISAESQPGKGTTVRFSLPVEGRDGR
jgi:signal transduction histidine kinase